MPQGLGETKELDQKYLTGKPISVKGLAQDLRSAFPSVAQGKSDLDLVKNYYFSVKEVPGWNDVQWLRDDKPDYKAPEKAPQPTPKAPPSESQQPVAPVTQAPSQPTPQTANGKAPPSESGSPAATTTPMESSKYTPGTKTSWYNRPLTEGVERSSKPPAGQIRVGGQSLSQIAEAIGKSGKERQSAGHKDSAFLRGMQQGALETGIDLTSPANLALLAGGEVIGDLGKGYKLLQWLSRGLRFGFTSKMGWELVAEDIPKANKAFESGDMTEAGRHTARALADAIFATKSARGVVDKIGKKFGLSFVPKEKAPPGSDKAPPTTENSTEAKAGTEATEPPESAPKKAAKPVERAAKPEAPKKPVSASVSRTAPTKAPPEKAPKGITPDKIKKLTEERLPKEPAKTPEPPPVEEEETVAPEPAPKPEAPLVESKRRNSIVTGSPVEGLRPAKLPAPEGDVEFKKVATHNGIPIYTDGKQFKVSYIRDGKTNTRVFNNVQAAKTVLDTAAKGLTTKAPPPVKPEPERKPGIPATEELTQPGGTPSQTKAKGGAEQEASRKHDAAIAKFQSLLDQQGVKHPDLDKLSGRAKLDAMKNPGEVIEQGDRTGIRFNIGGKQHTVWMTPDYSFSSSKPPSTVMGTKLSEALESPVEGKKPVTKAPPKAVATTKSAPPTKEPPPPEAPSAGVAEIKGKLAADLGLSSGKYELMSSSGKNKFQLRDLEDGNTVTIEATPAQMGEMFPNRSTTAAPPGGIDPVARAAADHALDTLGNKADEGYSVKEATIRLIGSDGKVLHESKVDSKGDVDSLRKTLAQELEKNLEGAASIEVEAPGWNYKGKRPIDSLRREVKVKTQADSIGQAKRRLKKSSERGSFSFKPTENSRMSDDVRMVAKDVLSRYGTFKEWSQGMIKILGNKVRPHLQAIWDYISTIDKSNQSDTSPMMNSGLSRILEGELSKPPKITAADSKSLENTKVKGSNGKPVVVYHGTPREFGEFDVSKATNIDPMYGGDGLYWTEDPNYAVGYALDEEHDIPNAAREEDFAPAIYKSYLDIKNPLDSSAKLDQRFMDSFKQDLEKNVKQVVDRSGRKAWAYVSPEGGRNFGTGGFSTKEEFINSEMENFHQMTSHNNSKNYAIFEAMTVLNGKDVNRIIKSLGYDGIKTKEMGHPTWVVFDSKQIKSPERVRMYNSRFTGEGARYQRESPPK